MLALAGASARTPNVSASNTSVAEPTILIVDDSAVDRRLAGSIIEKQLGMKAVYARDGSAALKLVESLRPCTILTDLLMPEMDGLELVEAVRRNYPLIPVILMTGHGSEDVAHQALKAGAASYVPKKNLGRVLAPTVEQVLSAAKAETRSQRLQGCTTEVTLQYSLENDPSLIPVLVGLYQEYLQLLLRCDRTEGTRLGIALEEAVLNALYHGNLQVGKELRQRDEMAYFRLAAARLLEKPYRDRRITVRLRVSRFRTEATVRDEGPGFDVAAWAGGQVTEDLNQGVGRGLTLIRNFMDEVSHNPAGNEVVMVKYASADLKE